MVKSQYVPHILQYAVGIFVTTLFKTHNTIQCGLNEYLQSILNSTANATLCLILNNYVRFWLIDSALGIEIGRPFTKIAFEDQILELFHSPENAS